MKEQNLHREVVRESKSIFYDTTGFQVDETQHYHLCRECAGYSEVSAKGLDSHIHAFTLPFNSCLKCQTKARDHFSRIKQQSNTIIVLQDRVEDFYEVK